jgi:hypothetical protein
MLATPDGGLAPMDSLVQMPIDVVDALMPMRYYTSITLNIII